MKSRLSEKGQALAEYMPLIPPILLLSVSFLIPVADHIGEIYCFMANSFTPAICEVAEPLDIVEEDEVVCTELQMSEGSSQCEQSGVCSVLPGVNAATFTATAPIESFVIKAGQNYMIYESGVTNDGCYLVDLSGNIVQWQKIGGGPNCKDVSHAQAWKVPLCVSE